MKVVTSWKGVTSKWASALTQMVALNEAVLSKGVMA